MHLRKIHIGSQWTKVHKFTVVLQERFRVEADVAVNRANMLTRLWKYSAPEVMDSEYLLHAGVFAMVEFDDDIFAAGNCYDQVRIILVHESITALA